MILQSLLPHIIILPALKLVCMFLKIFKNISRKRYVYQNVSDLQPTTE